MRIKNKEIRRRRHRKEQKIKDAARDTRAQYEGKGEAGKAKPKPTAKKTKAEA
jgi:ribosomal protein L44E